MTRRGQLVGAVIVGILGALVLGRWLAIRTVEGLWNKSLGIGAGQSDLNQLRVSIALWAFGAAAVWCIGNLYLVYQSIDSVHVPRRVANIEIVEAIPRRYLAWAVAITGLVLAFIISQDAGGWWQVRALVGSTIETGLRDPVLDRDAAYYLFRLPWDRLLHGFTTLSAGVMLGVVLLLYVAVGAVRIEGRRLVVSEMARRHLGGLLAAFALALTWGYRLEPPEFVSGIQPVPLDAVLTEVRLPTSRLLSAFALTAMAASLIWMRYDRIAVVGFGWIALSAFSIVGHYVIPGVAARARGSEDLELAGLNRASGNFAAMAFGLPNRDTVVQSAAERPRGGWSLARSPLWDPSTATLALNRIARPEPHIWFDRATLDVYLGSDGTPVPLLLAVQQVDLDAARSLEPELTWEDVHLGRYRWSAGAVAMRADTATSEGMPLFVADINRPDAATSTGMRLELRHPEILFAPGMTEFAVDTSTGAKELTGVPLGGLFRRLAFAWRLQSPQLVTADVNSSSRIIWRRSVVDRLERIAPFIDFSEPYPIAEDGGVRWLAFGYVSTRGFPLTRATDWQGQEVRYLRAGFVGMVHAATGAAAVYLLPGSDPLSLAWAARVPDLVRPAETMPDVVRRHLRYPDDLLANQMAVLLRALPGESDSRSFFRPTVSAPRFEVPPFTWFGQGVSDDRRGLRAVGVLQRGDPAVLEGIVEGTFGEAGPRLHAVRLGSQLDTPGLSRVASVLAAETDDTVVRGPLKTLLHPSGVLTFQTVYDPGTGADDPPRLAGIVAALGATIAQGRTLEEALRVAMARAPAPSTAHPDWDAARAWVRRLDAARRSGDWVAFGEAYQELLDLFELATDSVP